MSGVAIQVEGLGKRYRIGRRESYKTLRDSLADAIRAPFRRIMSLGRPVNQQQEGQDAHIWALQDVSFEVRRGDVLGIIGPNGAGKTTLLKILSRITEPTEGYAEIQGRVGSLLEVGTGFHPELTGRENIYLNGAILGMKRSEINQKFDEIVAFSGVEKFIDTPLKRYSSGMYVRLAFAVAAHLDPEILVVDEVLAVGDASFQEKCLGKMDEVARSGRTVLFVSHNMAAVRNLCSRAVLLGGGQIEVKGDTNEVIQKYLAAVPDFEEAGRMKLASRQDRSGSGRVRVVSFEASAYGGEESRPQTGSDVEFTIGYQAHQQRSIVLLHVAVSVMDIQGSNVFLCSTGMYHSAFHDIPSTGKAICKIKDFPLIPGEYWVNLMLKDDQGLTDSVNKAARLNVIDGGLSKILEIPSSKWGPVVVRHDWDWRPKNDANYTAKQWLEHSTQD